MHGFFPRRLGTVYESAISARLIDIPLHCLPGHALPTRKGGWHATHGMACDDVERGEMCWFDAPLPPEIAGKGMAERKQYGRSQQLARHLAPTLRLTPRRPAAAASERTGRPQRRSARLGTGLPGTQPCQSRASAGAIGSLYSTHLHNVLGSKQAWDGCPIIPWPARSLSAVPSRTRRYPHSHGDQSGRGRLFHPNAVCGSPYTHRPLRGRRSLRSGCETSASRSSAPSPPNRLASSTVYHPSPSLEPARCA